MSWNRQYRPRTIADLHLTAVRKYFTNLLSGNTFPQAFLFTGPKGTGKTSTARIIGALLNDPQNAAVVESLFIKKEKPAKKLTDPSSQSSELDHIFQGQSYLVQEMDAASNRGIDDIRALKERVQLPPVQGLISVYILDEVHMLTSEAFNALLKLLEEPPSHVVFILATTELQKVPETVTSRCQIVQFTLASEEELLAALEKVVALEKLDLDKKILSFLAAQANGSFRDAIKLLEQTAALKTPTLEEVEASLGRQYSLLIPQLATAVIEKNVQDTMKIFEQLREEGAHEVSFHKDLVSYLHTQLLIGAGVTDGNTSISFEAARFLLQEISASELSQTSPLPFLRLELKLLEIIERALKKGRPSEPPGSASKVVPPTIKKNYPDQHIPTVIKKLAASEDSLDTPITIAPVNSDTAMENLSGNGELLYQQWQTFVSHVAETNFSLATLLKSAQPLSGETGKLTLGVYYKFHQEQLLQPKFTQQLNALITSNYGGPVQINCILSAQPSQAELTEPTAADQLEKLATEALM